MQLGTALKEGLQVLVLGLGITLVALSLLILVIEIINKLVNIGKTSKTTIENEVDDNTDEEYETVLDDNSDQIKDEELVAAISAAIAIMLEDGNQPFRIRKIKQIPASTPKWNQVSRTEQLLNRR